MLTLSKHYSAASISTDNAFSDTALSLTLAFESRQKARLKTRLDNGQEVGLFLPRGIILRGGDILQAETDETIRIIAADEAVSTLKSSDPVLLSRCCYHLGNRHVPIEIQPTFARYLQDHVLDEMVVAFGIKLIHELAPFEPESGAYHSSHAH
jgi:urease accessory protein|tara:strand:+ start:1263 stop:1721 length:459 start_codon:yes stop_codon:yes gene_type:complete